MGKRMTWERFALRVPPGLSGPLKDALEALGRGGKSCRIVPDLEAVDSLEGTLLLTSSLSPEEVGMLRAVQAERAEAAWIVLQETTTPAQVLEQLQHGALAVLDARLDPAALARRISALATGARGALPGGTMSELTWFLRSPSKVSPVSCRDLAAVFGLDWLAVLENDRLLAQWLARGTGETPLGWFDVGWIGYQSDFRVVIGRFQTKEFDPCAVGGQVARAYALLAGASGAAHLFQTVERAKQAWEATVDAITDPIALTDGADTVLRANRAFAELAGCSVKEVPGFQLEHLGIRTDDLLASAPQEGDTSKTLHIAGRWYEPAARAVGKGGDQRRVLYLRDVTAERRLTAQLLQQERHSALGELAEGVFHDLNNLTSTLRPELKCASMIASSLQTHVQDHPLPGGTTRTELEDLASSLEAALTATRRLEQILSHLRQYARLRSGGRAEQETGPVDINRLLGALPILFGPRARTQGVSLDLSLQPLPVLEGRAGSLMRLFENLTKNALDAMPEGGVLQVRSDVEEGTIRIEFQDSGVGMPAETLSHIFDRGFSTRHEHGGTGLGLYLCRRIALDHGGRIAVRSAPGRGSVFTVEFPVDKD